MILVTGADGMVGSYVEDVFSAESLCLTDADTMDVTNYDAVIKKIEEVRPKIILHLAAATDVDRCQTDVDWAWRSNVIGTQNLAWVCQQKDIVMVYVSTGGLFDGSKEEAYTEFDSPNPLNVYARTKWEGEKVVQNLLHRYFIIRAGWMIGGGAKDKKFVAKMVELCRTKDTIQAVSDTFGTLTYAKDLLQTIRRLLATPFYGLYHVANQGVCTRYDIALEIKKFLRSAVHIEPVSSDRFPLPAPRPRSEAIRNYKLDLMGINEMPEWQKTLRIYLEEWL